MHARKLLIATLLTLALPAVAAEKTAEVHAVTADGIGEKIGTVTFADSTEGLVITPDLRQLSPGALGFHIHQKASCAAATKDGKQVAAGAAGGHYDPAGKGKHDGPHGMGHRGDLPVLMVNDDGTATEKMVAPRLKLAELEGRSVMIHEGGDNYSDSPKPLGGGGGRIACGVIE
jgi:Cu-Zn family superoxide dismutase